MRIIKKVMRIGNKQRILNFVLDHTNGKGGIQPDEIHKLTELSPHTVHEHLRELVYDKKIEKRRDKGHRREYRVTDNYMVSKEGFARIMRPMGRNMIYPILLTPDVITRSNLPVSDLIYDGSL